MLVTVWGQHSELAHGFTTWRVAMAILHTVIAITFRFIRDAAVSAVWLQRVADLYIQEKCMSSAGLKWRPSQSMPRTEPFCIFLRKCLMNMSNISRLRTSTYIAPLGISALGSPWRRDDLRCTPRARRRPPYSRWTLAGWLLCTSCHRWAPP